MADIVLPLASMNTAGNNVNVLTENGGTIYRTKSGDIIKQTLGNLSTASEDNISNLKFLAEQNGELKRISYTGDIGGGNGAEEGFTVIFSGQSDFYFNEWIEITSDFTVSHTFTEIVNEAYNREIAPNIVLVLDNGINVSCTLQSLSDDGIVFSNVNCPFFDDLAVGMLIQYTNTNKIYVLAYPINHDGRIEFYIDNENNITCNFSYEDFAYGMAMNLIPSSVKCYYENEFVGMMYFDGMHGESFAFSRFSSIADFAHTTSITYSYIINVNSDNTFTYSIPASTLNEGYDILWQNSDDDAVGEIYIPNINTSQYSAFTFGSIWSYIDEEYNWIFQPDVTITTNGYFSEEGNSHYYLDGPSPTIYGAYTTREVTFGSNYLRLSDGIVALSESEVFNDSGVMVPGVIMGIKMPQQP